MSPREQRLAPWGSLPPFPTPSPEPPSCPGLSILRILDHAMVLSWVVATSEAEVSLASTTATRWPPVPRSPLPATQARLCYPIEVKAGGCKGTQRELEVHRQAFLSFFKLI
jgi:hypothetical protein